MPDVPLPLHAGIVRGARATSGLRWLWLALAVVVVDQATKAALQAWLAPGELHRFTSFFAFVLAYNTGAAFSFLAGAAGWQRWLFSGIAVVAVVLIVFLLRRGGSRLFCAGLALILGGAIGNLIDRVVLGKVVDFILVHYEQWVWPAFNVADSALTVGAALLIVDSFRVRHVAAANDAEA
ncbi:MAG: lipoprotein signal peptidase [Proteobacteria bacterium]|nr:lipoprotein signal peptidase [Pseudomonadota bacterium]